MQCVLATKMEQAPAESYTERMKHTQAKKSHDSKRMLSGSEKTALFGVPLLISQPMWLSFNPNVFTGRIFFPLKLVSDL